MASPDLRHPKLRFTSSSRETAIVDDGDDGGGGGEELALLSGAGAGAARPGTAKIQSRAGHNAACSEEIRISIIGGGAPAPLLNGGQAGARTPTPTPEVYSTSPSTPSELQERPPAVVVEHGFKNYGTTRILSDFNMLVHQNTIYGLLGASGCGKTTILSCIVALKTLDSGRVRICGWPTGCAESGIPGKRVGYMPQEIALNGEFRVKEVLQYFGRIYGMSQEKISARFEYIVGLLSMDKFKDNLIRNCSEGQKRRVSMAVAMLHEPEILILDEPTVGCDPLLRENIWKFLTELVAQRKTTVIVTTHYIEETRKADRVGIMRNGRLLVEEAPEQLLVLYNATLLDEIVLQLCHKDEREEQHTPSRRRSSIFPARRGSLPLRGWPEPASNAKEPDIPTCASCHKKLTTETKRLHKTAWADRLRALILKNVIVLWRNLMFLLFLIIMPTITVLVFCFCVGGEPLDLRLGVVNNELLQFPSSAVNSTATSSAWVTMRHLIRQAEDPLQCENRNLSCLFLDSIDKKQVKLVPFDSIDAAVAEVRLSKLWGYIAFESDFSQHIFTRLMLGKRNNATIWGSQIRVRLDMSNKGVGLTLKKLLFDAFREFSRRLLVACSIPPEGRDLPVTFEPAIYGNDEKDDMIEFMAPGVGLGMIFFMGALCCGLTYIIEKKDGMINRTLVTGVSTTEIMLSHFITQFVVVFGQVIVVMVVILAVFGLPCEGSLFLAFVIMMLSSISGMSLGFLAATFCNEEKNAMLVAMGTVFPSFMLAGLIWPIESAPRAVQYISFLLPGTLNGEAFRSVLLRGFGLDHHVIWEGIIATLAWISVYWLITVAWHRLNRKS